MLEPILDIEQAARLFFYDKRFQKGTQNKLSYLTNFAKFKFKSLIYSVTTTLP